MSYHSYHIEGGDASFKELPSRILMREDGYLSAYRLDGEPIADYWYAPESECLKLRTENSKLRELIKRYHHLVTGTDELWSWQSVYEQLHELGVEV